MTPFKDKNWKILLIKEKQEICYVETFKEVQNQLWSATIYFSVSSPICRPGHDQSKTKQAIRTLKNDKVPHLPQITTELLKPSGNSKE